MARNTNIQEFLFPVWVEPICLENASKPIRGFKAVVGRINETDEVVFSVVSSNYQLVTNLEAYEMGKKIHNRLFPNATGESFEVFNVIAPKSKSSCIIDIIDKDYKLNIWKQEVYVPFLRVHNSYNRMRSLGFDIGFCRKLCNNGVIYEQQTIALRYAHTKNSLKLEGIEDLNVDHLKKLEIDFVAKTKGSINTELPKKYFIPLSARVLNRSLKIQGRNEKARARAKQKKEQFIHQIGEYSRKYIYDQKLGENAYAFFNVITDYSSNSDQVSENARNGLQTRCGQWISSLEELVKGREFSWEREVEDFAFLLNSEGD